MLSMLTILEMANCTILYILEEIVSFLKIPFLGLSAHTAEPNVPFSLEVNVAISVISK